MLADVGGDGLASSSALTFLFFLSSGIAGGDDVFRVCIFRGEGMLVYAL